MNTDGTVFVTASLAMADTSGTVIGVLAIDSRIEDLDEYLANAQTRENEGTKGIIISADNAFAGMQAHLAKPINQAILLTFLLLDPTD